MAKGSSNKKVARAAKAGGSRARAAGERNIVFPLSLAIVCILGIALIVYARDQRTASALERPLAFDDHWHASYGIYVCDEFLPDLPEFTAPQNGGTHTHGDGLLHIHPFSNARSGANATLANYFADAGEVLGGGDAIENDRLGVPGDRTYVEGEDVCEGVEGDPVVQVLVWESAQAALDGAEPDVRTEDFDGIRFSSDGMAFVIAYAPLDADIPIPPSTSGLSSVGSDLGVTPDSVPEGEDLSDIGGETGDAEESDDTADLDETEEDSSTSTDDGTEAP